MKHYLAAQQAKPIRRGAFNIDINFPGLAVGNPADKRGLAQLGRFDHANLEPGVFVGMHPHKNDEILSYLRTGELVHEDTTGDTVTISNTKLMLMNAGSGIQHQESIPRTGNSVEMLQIFMRPNAKDLTPNVQFADLETAYSLNKWRLIAGAEQAPLQVNSDVYVYDMRLEKSKVDLPQKVGKQYLLYVFAGSITEGEQLIEAGNSLVYEAENLQVQAIGQADLILFELNPTATYIRTGMYSGA